MEKVSELELALSILIHSAWFLGGCLLLVGIFFIVKNKRESKQNAIKEIMFRDTDRPNGKPKITKGKF